MNIYKIFISLYVISISYASPLIKVAVIDTGIRSDAKVKICDDGLKDFTGTGIDDNRVHGSIVSSLIEKYSKKANYCQLIIKWYDPKIINDTFLTQSIEYAIDRDVDIINLSGGGTDFHEEEYRAIMKALDKKIIVVVAAGNEHCSMPECTYYPAMYDKRIIVVGSKNSRGISSFSNRGDIVKRYEYGENINMYGKVDSGTSFAAPITTGKIVRVLYKLKMKRGKNEKIHR